MKKIITIAAIALLPCFLWGQEKGTEQKQENESADVPKMDMREKHEGGKEMMRGKFIDADGDGINDIKPGQKMGPMTRMKRKGMEGFTDKDGDGINDNRAKGMGWSGKGRGRGFGKH